MVGRGAHVRIMRSATFMVTSDRPPTIAAAPTAVLCAAWRAVLMRALLASEMWVGVSLGGYRSCICWLRSRILPLAQLAPEEILPWIEAEAAQAGTLQQQGRHALRVETSQG